MTMNPLLKIIAPVALLLSVSGCSKEKVETIVLTGSSTLAPVVADAALRFEASHPGVKVDVQTGGSSRGIADALSGLADLGMISRDLKPDESGLVAYRIAMDGVGVILHRDNPLADLSRQQLIDIYTGKVSSWSAFGGPEAKIVVASKAEGRATLEVFLGYTGLDSADIKADVIVGENQQAIKTVAGNPNAIAYVSIGAATSEAAAGTPIKLVKCDGVDATSETVAKGDFPITRPLQVVALGELSMSATAFLDFLKSPQINDFIESHGYVPLAN